MRITLVDGSEKNRIRDVGLIDLHEDDPQNSIFGYIKNQYTSCKHWLYTSKNSLDKFFVYSSGRRISLEVR